VVESPFDPNRNVSRISNIKILITLPGGAGSVSPEEFMTEDLGEEDILVFWV
jgi:hypothetical protein